MQLRKPLFLLLLFTCLLAGCDDCVFTSRNTSIVNFRFYRKGNPRQVQLPTFFKVTTGANISIQAKDTIKLTAAAAAVSIRLHPFQDTSSFYFNYAPNRKDFIRLKYTRSFGTTSPRCGYDQRIDNLQVVDHSFDSIAIFKSSLEIGDTVNIRVYLK